MTEIVKSQLQELADKANEEHRSCEKTFRFALGHAMRAGDALNEAKELVAHGQWLPWLEENFEGSVRVAQTYMRLAKHRDELANTQNSAHLSIDAALKELAAPKPEEPEEEPETVEDGREDIREFFRKRSRAALAKEREALEAEMEQDRVAEFKKATREAEERHRERQRRNLNLMLMEADQYLSKARKELRKVLDLAREVDFDEEAIELLGRQTTAVREMATLVCWALESEPPDIDWDAELAALEHRREWGHDLREEKDSG